MFINAIRTSPLSIIYIFLSNKLKNPRGILVSLFYIPLKLFYTIKEPASPKVYVTELARLADYYIESVKDLLQDIT